MKTKTLAERIKARVTKRDRAQARLNKAAKAWLNIEGYAWLENHSDGHKVMAFRLELARAARAFERESK